jgi:hypothetical protein
VTVEVAYIVSTSVLVEAVTVTMLVRAWAVSKTVVVHMSDGRVS